MLINSFFLKFNSQTPSFIITRKNFKLKTSNTNNWLYKGLNKNEAISLSCFKHKCIVQSNATNSPVFAYISGYENTNFSAQVTPVEDGTWTTASEWTDAMTPPNLPASFHWRQKWTYPENIIEHFLIEFFDDDTNDTGDYFQLCVDTNANGGTAPQLNDIRIDWVGHSVVSISLSFLDF